MSLQRLFTKFSKSLEDKDSNEDYKKEDITLHVMRVLANPIVQLLNPYGFITPNRITWFGFFCVIFGALVLIISGDNLILLGIVAVSYWLSSYFDTVDGMLARKRGIASKNGAWLDSILEEGKGYFFFFALALHIQDSNGLFTLNFGATPIITLNVWMVLFIMYGAERWLALMALWGNMILEEPRVVSMGHIYIVGIFLLLNILDWFLVIYTILVIIGVVYTLVEKTFFFTPFKKSE
ncbi:MAG: CDP-alcohol phosphatidyltransferase family protein [Candidatus Heimdallarchaeota archaeon]|nr:CDP-alcohol phosphatidyltransferase family protein [Candidatus Heimdallarchaeota archaeon]